MSHPITYNYANRHSLLLITGAINQLFVSDKTSRSAIGEVLRKFGAAAVACLPHSELVQRISDAYTGAGAGEAARLVSAVQEEANFGLLIQEVERTQDLLASEDGAPVIRILNALLLEGAKAAASDIHIEPYEENSVVRLRIDGVLREIAKTKREIHKALISRLKIMAGLDIAEARLPQDGRISTRLGNRLIDIRVSTLPNAYGERAVLRLLDKSGEQQTLESLGMSPALVSQFDALLKKPHGLILVTGPTGSGKTTTLYSALKRMDAARNNIMTVENPIENELPGIAQTQINPKIGYNFADALRSILRQDPDIVMVGEIRDTETAKIAIQASLTGHLVLATLHTNDASSAITRLADMGIQPYLLASSLLGVLGQRLVRKFDPKNPGQLRGRIGIYELLTVNEKIKTLINNSSDDNMLRQAAITGGMHTMRQYGEAMVAEGTTTMQEVMLATSD